MNTLETIKLRKISDYAFITLLEKVLIEYRFRMNDDEFLDILKDHSKETQDLIHISLDNRSIKLDKIRNGED